MHYFGKAATIAEQAKSYPKTLRHFGVERILHRKIIKWSGNLGSYGMGGPGFFGVKLTSTNLYAEEWLVLILWGADNWLLLNGQWVAANLNQYQIQKPLLNQLSEDQWDNLSDKLIDATITSALVKNNSSLICLQKESIEHKLEIPSDPKMLPVFAGNGKQRIWFDHENQLDAWVIISTTAELFC
ncbi:MAG: hypothetical protein J0L96_02455 [Anaerolineae bacterium]|nr:hypothetical protein [Anaerolineae bacterium]